MHLSSVPQVQQFMTRTPHTLGSDQPLKKALEMMTQYQIRHLPVRRAGKLIGLISERTLKEALGHPQGGKLTAEDVMLTETFCVAPQTPLDEVVAAMAEEKYGSALIEDEEGKLVGIFTTVDACRALRQILESRFSECEGRCSHARQ